MSLEARVETLEKHHKQMDACLHGLARVCADIKNISLTNQHDIAELKADVSGLTACVKTLAEATHAGFRRTDEQHGDLVKHHSDLVKHHSDLVKEVREFKQETRERFDQLELLIRQSLPRN